MIGILVALATLAAPSPATAPATTPATAPSTAPASRPARPTFKLVQEHRVGDRPPVSLEFWFAGDHCILLNDALEPITYFDLAGERFYSQRDAAMRTRKIAHAWATGARAGRLMIQNLKDPKAAAFSRDMMWPKLTVEEREGKLRVLAAAGAIEYAITSSKQPTPVAADSFAAAYRLDAYRNAVDTSSPLMVFLVADVAGVLEERDVEPQTMTITTRTAKENAVVTVSFRSEPLTRDEQRVVAVVAAKLDPDGRAPRERGRDAAQPDAPPSP